MANSKLRTMLEEDYDQESNALTAVVALLKPLSFDAQWRILNYVLVRLWNRSWLLARPKADGNPQ